jgi:hypothetical protein
VLFSHSTQPAQAATQPAQAATQPAQAAPCDCNQPEYEVSASLTQAGPTDCGNRSLATSKMTPEIREYLSSRALDRVYWPNRAPVVVDPNHAEFYRSASTMIGSHNPIIYLEFGVAQGHSMLEMVKCQRNPESRFIGFDSFEGLPESWLMHDKGAFTNHGTEPTVNDPRARFVKGWFQNTVPTALEALRIPPTHQVLVHYDADLYSSTLFLLAMLWPRIDSYYFIFDDFIYDDCVALADFCGAFPVKVEFFMQTRGGGPGPNPDQVFGRMTRVPFQPPTPVA